MAKTREVACRYYIAEKQCELGKEGTFYRSCQRCSKYSAIPGGRPARKDLRREKNEKFMNDRRNFE